jgi:hypothetical protein
MTKEWGEGRGEGRLIPQVNTHLLSPTLSSTARRRGSKDDSPGFMGATRVKSPGRSHFGPERGWVVPTSRSHSAIPKDFLAYSVLRLVLRTQPRSKMRIAGLPVSQ